MCLTCGCGEAHKPMGTANVTYEDLRDAAVENGKTVDETLEIMATTAATDRADHLEEYDRPWDTGKG
jgi:hypothetical protein